MLNVSIVIPAWNEEERINDCLLNATRQTVMPHEVIVVDNRSTDSTVAMVEQFIKDHPEAPVRLLHQDEEQGLIPTRDYGLNHATGDILGRFDADCMIRPDWVEVVSGIFTEDPEAMGATGPVMYYDLRAAILVCVGIIPHASVFTRPMAASRCCLARIWRSALQLGAKFLTKCAETRPM